MGLGGGGHCGASITNLPFFFNLKKKDIISEIKHYSKNKDAKKKSVSNLRKYRGCTKSPFGGGGTDSP